MTHRHQQRERLLHTAAVIAAVGEQLYDHPVGARVTTCDGLPGVVTAVHDGPYPGTEAYQVELDHGMGGGTYSPGQIQAAPVRVEGTAAADYPELAQVLTDRPDPAAGHTPAHRLAAHALLHRDLGTYTAALANDGHAPRQTIQQLFGPAAAQHAAAAEMTLGETIAPRPVSGPGPTRAASPLDNPASSGWATGSDPDDWSRPGLFPLDQRLGGLPDDSCEVCKGPVSELERRNCAYCDWGGHHSDCCPDRRGGGGGGGSGDDDDDTPPVGGNLVSVPQRRDFGLAASLNGSEAELHDTPEPALPSTDGAGDTDANVDSADPEALTPQSFTAMLADFQASAAHLDPRGRTAGPGDGDIAAAAQAHLAGLSKSAAYDFSPAERRALIEEGTGLRAANADRLDLSGTHYAELETMLGQEQEDAPWTS